MLGGYLEFFTKPAVAEMYQCLRGELDELIQNKVSETMTKFSLNVILSLNSIFLFVLLVTFSEPLATLFSQLHLEVF